MTIAQVLALVQQLTSLIPLAQLAAKTAEQSAKIARAQQLAEWLTAAATEAESAGQVHIDLTAIFRALDDAARNELVDSIAAKGA